MLNIARLPVKNKVFSMRPEFIAALALAFLLLFGCTLPFQQPDIQDFPPKNISGPLKEAKSLVEKSNLPLPSKDMAIPVPSSLPQETTEGEIATEGSTGPEQNATAIASPPVLASNNSSTPVTAPSNESAEELPTEISIANPVLLQIYYYYSTYCPYSMRIKPFMDRQQVRFENVTEWHTFDVSTRQGYYFFDKMARERNLTNASRVVPFAIADGSTFIGIEKINKSFALTVIKATK